jgi:hypothetical protein
LQKKETGYWWLPESTENQETRQEPGKFPATQISVGINRIHYYHHALLKFNNSNPRRRS